MSSRVRDSSALAVPLPEGRSLNRARVEAREFVAGGITRLVVCDSDDQRWFLLDASSFEIGTIVDVSPDGIARPIRNTEESDPYEAAERYRELSRSDATRRAYKASWRAWESWCLNQGLSPLEARPADVAAFLAAEAGQGLSLSTLRQRVAAIRHVCAANDRANPARAAIVDRTLAGIARGRARQSPRQARALGADELKQILGPIETILASPAIAASDPMARLRALRDRALLLLGWGAGLRRSELAGLRVEDLVFPKDGGLAVRLVGTKSRQAGHEWAAAPPAEHTGYDAARAMRIWLDAAGILEPAYAVFVDPASRNGRKPMSDRHIARIIQARAAAVGLGPGVSGHSLRRGAATEALERPDVALWRSQQFLRHADPRTTSGYGEFRDALSRHPLRGLL